MRVWTEIEQAQNQHLLKMQKDEDQYQARQRQQWDGYAASAGSALTSLVFRHQTAYQIMQQYEEKFFNYAADQVLKMVAHWLMGEAQKIAATEMGASVRAAAESSGASVGLIAQSATFLKSIIMSAAETFGGIFGFLAPVMGPAAAGPAASGQGMVLAMEGFAAAGGYDIPAGTNPVVFAHQKEMILPAHLADRVRSMTDPGGSGAGSPTRGGTFNMHINATDASSFEKQLGRSNSELNRMIRRSIRDGNLPLRR